MKHSDQTTHRETNQTLRARREGIYEESLGDKTILFDTTTRLSVTLDPTAAFVWSRCDGETTTGEIVAAYQQKAPGSGADAGVFAAINLLAGKGLLLDENSMPVAPTAHSRRAMLNYGALAAKLAILFPALASILGPSGAEAATMRPPRSVQPVSTGTRRRGSNGGGRGRGNGQKGPGRGNHQTPPAAVDCYGAWDEWSECDFFLQGRKYNVIEPAANGGLACEAADGATETRMCGSRPVDCDAVAGDWSACSTTCGGGTQTREVMVLVPAANGGAPCPTESQVCNTQSCALPVDCVGEYSWTPCSTTCGGGTQSRIFTVTTPASNGGAPCPVPTETQPCNTGGCATSVVNQPCDACPPTHQCIFGVNRVNCLQVCPAGFPAYCCFFDPATAYAMANPDYNGWNLTIDTEDPDCPNESLFTFWV